MADYQALTVKVRERVRKIKYCPITGGAAVTRMSEESFRRQCAVQQELAKNDGPGKPGESVRVLWCRQCKGERLPAGLEFVDLLVGREVVEQQKKKGVVERVQKHKKDFVLFNSVRKIPKGETMPKSDMGKEPGKMAKVKNTVPVKSCDVCGVSGVKLQPDDDMMVCASCKPVLVAARNRPEAIILAADKYKLMPMAELCETEPQISDEDLQAKVDNLGFIEERLERLEGLAQRIGDLWAAYTELETMRIAMRQGS